MGQNTKTYLADFTFIAGDHEQSFNKVIESDSKQGARTEALHYMANYSGDAELVDFHLFSYDAGQIMLKLNGIDEVTDNFESFINNITL